MSTKIRIIKDVQILRGRVKVFTGSIMVGTDCVTQILKSLDGQTVRISIQTQITEKIADKGDDNV